MAVVLAMAATLNARRTSIGVLRALGAPTRFIFSVVWLQGLMLVASGVAIGAFLGLALVTALGATISAHVGFALNARLASPEWQLLGTLLVVGSALAALPSLATLASPVAKLLRQG